MNLVSLKTQLFIAFSLMVLPLVAVVWAYMELQNDVPLALQKQEEIGEIRATALKVQRDVIDLQRNVLIFKENASVGSIEKFQYLYGSISERVLALSARTLSEEGRSGLGEISEHLAEYRNNFLLVVSLRKQRDALVDEVLSFEIEAQGVSSEDISLSIANSKNAILQYFLTSNSEFISVFKTGLRRDRKYVLTKIQDSEVQASLLKQLDQYERAFLGITSITRNYIYLINVVMAGSANEILFLSSDVVDRLNEQQSEAYKTTVQQVSERVDTSLYLTGVSAVLMLGMVFYFFGLIARPIERMTEVFNSLAKGESVGRIPGLDREDEIGKMAAAANVFRDKNDQTTQLLNESQQLVEQQKVLNDALFHEKKRVERALAVRSEFLANMSHELRTPLNSVIGFTARLLKNSDHLGERYRDSLETIARNGQHLLAMINDILDLSKIEANKLEVAPEAVDIRQLCLDCIEQVEGLARDKHLELKVELDDNLGEIHTDPTRISQILLNLLSNAIKYTHKGWVQVVLCQGEQSDSIMIAVADSGIGVASEDMKNLFERFEQFDERSQTKVGSGTGLGLAIVSKISKLLGAKIHVESNLGEGSRFSLNLPKHYQPVDSRVSNFPDHH